MEVGLWLFLFLKELRFKPVGHSFITPLSLTQNLSEYNGESENGKRHGQGTYKWTTGDKFKGKWEAGIRDGKGFLKYSKGTKYDGFWKDDEPSVRKITTWSISLSS